LKVAFAASSIILLAGLAAGCGGDTDTSELGGKHWVLASARDVPLPLGVVPTAGFHEGVVRGYTGCNQYSASYSVDGDSLEVGELATTRMACEPPRDEVEKQYVRALGQVTTWSRDGDELVLSNGEGELLRYNQARTGGDI
jgi:heat shock protein HslJ